MSEFCEHIEAGIGFSLTYDEAQRLHRIKCPYCSVVREADVEIAKPVEEPPMRTLAAIAVIGLIFACLILLPAAALFWTEVKK